MPLAGGFLSLNVIIDFDGTLTAEEKQARPLAERSLETLANEIIDAPLDQLRSDYAATRAKLLRDPHLYWWEVNGLIATYCDEGAFILNTSTLQHMIADNEQYRADVAAAYPDPEYSPVVDCTNDLFHRHTAEFAPAFRPGAREVLSALFGRSDRFPMILTNSRSDKVKRQLKALELGVEIPILGDTRQYEMDPKWSRHFALKEKGLVQVWPLSRKHMIDLRRPDYYRALAPRATDDKQTVVIADTFSMPGALPLIMGIPYILLRTAYTPSWCLRAVTDHPLGWVLEDLMGLPTLLDDLQYLKGSPHARLA
jgi:phosphoglycolate phosphatase-like HAD superfamily hydrolase